MRRFDLVAGAISSSSMRAMAVSRYVEYHLSGYRDILPTPASSILFAVLFVPLLLCCRKALSVSVRGLEGFWSLFSSE